MILFCTIVAIVAIILFALIFLLGSLGAGFLIVFADVIVCIALFGIIIWYITHRKKKE